jgi:hypothetical protein
VLATKGDIVLLRGGGFVSLEYGAVEMLGQSRQDHDIAELIAFPRAPV